jgi:hypothetical protein
VADALLENLQAEFESRRSLISQITNTAAEQGRGLSDQDRQTVEQAKERMASLSKDIELLSDQIELSEASQRALQQANRSESDPSAYESVGALIRDRLDAAVDTGARDRYLKTLRRAAQHMGTTAANTVPTAGGMPGLIVTPNRGPVIDLSPKGRPLLAALGVTPSTDPLSFRRPKLVDSNFTSGVGVQAKEKAELASGKFDIDADTVNLSTIGGYLNISAQLQALPIGALDISYAQLRRRVENATEAAAVTSMLTGANDDITLATRRPRPVPRRRVRRVGRRVRRHRRAGDVHRDGTGGLGAHRVDGRRRRPAVLPDPGRDERRGHRVRGRVRRLVDRRAAADRHPRPVRRERRQLRGRQQPRAGGLRVPVPAVPGAGAVGPRHADRRRGVVRHVPARRRCRCRPRSGAGRWRAACQRRQEGLTG